MVVLADEGEGEGEDSVVVVVDDDVVVVVVDDDDDDDEANTGNGTDLVNDIEEG